ncbi:MAG: hypothetical protein U9R15_05795 [Chloroflexota bacterium]|nr:hypothetical protein [Chloroflexota bacterium]
MYEHWSITWYRREAEESQRPYHIRKGRPPTRTVNQGDIVTAVRGCSGDWGKTSSVVGDVKGRMVQVNGYWYNIRDVKTRRSK